MDLNMSSFMDLINDYSRLAALVYLVLFSGQKYQTYRDCWEGSVKQYFQWLKDIFSLFCVLCIIFKMAAICLV